MAFDQLKAFILTMQADDDLRQTVMAASTADDVAKIAYTLGFEFSGDELLRFNGKKWKSHCGEAGSPRRVPLMQGATELVLLGLAFLGLQVWWLSKGCSGSSKAAQGIGQADASELTAGGTQCSAENLRQLLISPSGLHSDRNAV